MIDEIAGFFMKKPKADMLFFRVAGSWGSPWTVAAHEPAGAHRIAEQCIKMRADGLRHAEHVRLQFRHGVEDAVVITDLPTMQQTIVMLETGELWMTDQLVESPTLSALRAAVGVANVDSVAGKGRLHNPKDTSEEKQI